MLNGAVPEPLASAATVFFGPHGAVTRHAQRRGVSRQRLYREAHRARRAVDGSDHRHQLDSLRRQLRQRERQLRIVRRRLRHAPPLTRDQQEEFAATAQAEGVSLPVTRRLLAVALRPGPRRAAQRIPSVAQLGRFAQAAAQRATAVLAELDAVARPLVTQAAADEIFVGRKPILMTVEPKSMCWLNGRLAESRTGDEWVKEFRTLPALQQLTRDGGTGLENGLRQVNAERAGAGLPAVAGQADHFHLLREGMRALRRMRSAAAKALERAEKAQKLLNRVTRHGKNRAGHTHAAGRCWRMAEAAFDRWSGAERAWHRVRAALEVFRADGTLNTRAQATAAITAALVDLAGSEWDKVRRQVTQPEVFTFLDRVAVEMAAIPVASELRDAALTVEGLRRHPEALRGEGPSAGAMRGVVLAAGLILTLGGEMGVHASVCVGAVLRGVRRASSVVEGLNSVVRMQQARHRRLTQGLLDLKRLYWNCRTFRTGPRKDHTPYELLGVKRPPLCWWELQHLSPTELRQHLSAIANGS